MRDGLEGRTETKAPGNWEPIYDRLQGANNSGRMALELAQKFGDTSAAESMLKTWNSKDAKLEQRQQALRQLAAQRRPEVADRLVSLYAQTSRDYRSGQGQAERCRRGSLERRAASHSRRCVSRRRE